MNFHPMLQATNIGVREEARPAVKMEGHQAHGLSLEPMGSHRECLLYCLLEVSLSNKSPRKNSCARKGRTILHLWGLRVDMGPNSISLAQN